MKELFKDIIISLLLVLCIFFIIAIAFYDKISLGKVIPESDDYELSQQMQQELKNNTLDEIGETIVNYQIDAEDLKKYEKSNEYVKGKSNPFAAESIVENNTNSTENNNSNSPSNSNSTQQNGFYEDDGTK